MEAHDETLDEMCNCNKKVGQANCKYITVELLQDQKNIYQCVKNNNYYLLVNMSEDYVNQQLDLITTVLEDKKINSNSCRYSQYQNTFNLDIQNIIKYVSCP